MSGGPNEEVPATNRFGPLRFAMGAVFEQGRMAAMSLVASLGPIPEAGVKVGDSMGVGLSVGVVEQWRKEAWADAKRRLGQ